MRLSYLKGLLLLLFTLAASCGDKEKIDRRSVVERHNIITTRFDSKSPAQVGNGNFAFCMDITGMQSFVPFNTMSQWSWHSDPLPEGCDPADYKTVVLDTHGSAVGYEIPDPDNPEISHWLAGNPHRFNLGRIGMRLLKKDGAEATESDLENVQQKTELWSGIVYSHFTFDGETVSVVTACHPDSDAIAVKVDSPLVHQGRIEVFFDFPYTTQLSVFEDHVGNYDMQERHTSIIQESNKDHAVIDRYIDDVHYYVMVGWTSPATFGQNAYDTPHKFVMKSSDGNRIEFTCSFGREKHDKFLAFEEVKKQSERGWEKFWTSGAAVDLSGSTDPRWHELERRIVLSQYLMKVNEAGELPPQESGLVNNGWYGRFHFEMIWWHCVHYALWDRWDEIGRSLEIYRKFLPTSKERAHRQGYSGARWPKCTADIDREWPHLIHATLIWQQPHPIYFAELDYRLHPAAETLDKWKEVVFETADFMADYAYYDGKKEKYVLGPPLYIVSENTDPEYTSNPAFELSYWRFGLRVAQLWKERLGIPADKKWAEVLDGLSSLPAEDGVYVTHEGIDDMWNKYTFEHPALIGTLGMLPGDGVDPDIFRRTLLRVAEKWNFDRTWGWDFPMLAMAAARSGFPEMALDFILYDSPNFQFDEHGLATGGPFPYFPSNGALLTAVAMMSAGWDGAEEMAPGFPQDGSWNVKFEGFNRMP